MDYNMKDIIFYSLISDLHSIKGQLLIMCGNEEREEGGGRGRGRGWKGRKEGEVDHS